MKKALLFLFLCIGYASYGQTIYEIKYSFNKLDQYGKETNEQDKQYDALLFYNGTQQTNTMRVRYYDADLKAEIIVEQKVTASLYDQDGKQYWALVGQNPQFVSTVKPTYQYNPDKIILAKNPSDQYYSPAYVTSTNESNGQNGQTGKIISFTTLMKNNISNDFLLQFGWKWPDKQENEGQNTSFDISKSTLYLIQVTNSQDEKLGPGFYENHKIIKQLFSAAAQACNIKFNSVEIMGNDFSKDNVISAIANCNPGPNDIVIFYYSGHGYRYTDQVSDWPRMALSNNYQTIEDLHKQSLSLDDDVYKPLSTKGAHLLMVIGECCNTAVGATPYMNDPVRMHSGDYIIDPTYMKSLFSQKGNLLLATSKPDESTWYYLTAGGCFGNNFVSSLFKEVNFTNTNPNVNWKDIFDNSVQETINRTASGEAPKEQDPIMHFDIQ